MKLLQIERTVKNSSAEELRTLAESSELTSSTRKRRRFVGALGLNPAPEIVGIAIRYLDDPDEEIRAIAADSLANRNSRAAETALIKALNSESDMVRAAAAKSLQTSGSVECIPALESALESDTTGIRARAVAALSRISGQQSIDALVRALDNDDPYVRREVVGALRQVGDTRVVPEIEARIGGETRLNRPTFRAAVEALRQSSKQVDSTSTSDGTD